MDGEGWGCLSLFDFLKTMVRMGGDDEGRGGEQERKVDLAF